MIKHPMNYSIKNHITDILTEILVSLGYSGVTPEVSRPENADHGEYTTNVAMILAQKNKLRPIDVAKKIQGVLEGVVASIQKEAGDLTTYQTGQTVPGFQIKPEWKNVLQAIEKIEIAGPGFLNIHFDEVKLSTLALQLPFSEDGVKRRRPERSRRMMVEFTDPNPFKELHIGHLYSNAVGESISRLYETLGWEVKRADYFGDVGMHVAKSIWGIQKKLHDEGVTMIQIAKKSTVDRVHWLGSAYAIGSEAYETDEKAKEEMKKINTTVYTKEPGEIAALYATGRQWSMEYFETVFRRLGTRFDYYYPESIVGEYGAKIVGEHLKDGIFVKNEGAVIFEGEKVGLHNRVFLNSLGLPTYEAKELGLNWKKHEDYKADVSLIVTGKEINEYFTVLLAAMSKVLPDVAKKTKHIGHGMVRLPSGKMSSRTGTVVTGESLIDIVKQEIYNKVLDNISKGKDNETSISYTDKEKEEIAEACAIAAIKYSFLRIALPGDLIFDIEKSLSLSGDSGPYLLYTYARCQSVLRKASGQSKEIQGLVLNSEEHSLARLLLYFPEIISEAADLYAPNILCTYLFQLAQAFNLFYQKCPILENPYRLKLTDAVAQVLKKGLYLLGIQTVERM